MRILVAGAAGFLGSHLCDRLVKRGHVVTGLDNYQTGRRENLDQLAGHRSFTIIEHDIVVPFDGAFERIFNLACPASPPDYQRDAIATLRTCVIGTDNLLALAVRTGARFFQASTSEVYGDPEVHPQPESYRGSVNPIGVRACYDEGKRAAETLCFDYHRQRGVEIRVARIFNTYGPRMNPTDGRVVSNLIVQALRGEDMTVYGDGRQTRSFCYCDDLLEGCLRIMDAPGEIVGPINLGNPDEMSIGELAQLVRDMTGTSARLVNRALPSDDPVRRCPDISRARELLGWSPQVALRDGLRKTIAYFEDSLAVEAQ
ncbi:MAG TPA: UDP-glucuronic acid decarboxylase family protein [Aestuariivirgaceae bacterium]|nr:UDP-glucuronic acid decarboxylase family protein [Aestuariivirgaceae bacterium]